MSRQIRDIAESLGDFTATPRLLVISLFAACIGAVSAFVALALLKLIGLFTNLFFFQRVSTALITPAGMSRKAICRSPDASVLRNPARSPRAARRASDGKRTVVIATEKMPCGSM